MIKIARNLSLLAVLFSAGACSSGENPVDIGDGRTGEKLEDYAAHWEGYAEAHKFDDGSDKVSITLDASGNGTFQIGSRPTVPIATDASVGYPPNVPFPDRGIENLFSGVPYSIHTATVESQRIQFSINPWEAESDWCTLQTSYPWYEGQRYSCNPFANILGTPSPDACLYHTDGLPDIPVDCAKAMLCQGDACSCDAQGCSTREVSSNSLVKIDAALRDAGNTLVGTLLLATPTGPVPMTVRLARLTSG